MKQYVGSVTRFIDECLIDSLKHSEVFRTYLVKTVKKGEYQTWAIRVPGATRGQLWTDSNGIIVRVMFDAQTSFSSMCGCYKPELYEAKEQLIGQNVNQDLNIMRDII